MLYHFTCVALCVVSLFPKVVAQINGHSNEEKKTRKSRDIASSNESQHINHIFENVIITTNDS